MMDRRAFLGTLAGGLLAAPLAAEAQPAGKVHRIGITPDPLLASARNGRTGTSYSNIIAALDAMQAGDTIEISPGEIVWQVNAGASQPFGGGTACYMPLRLAGTYKAMDPTKRPVIGPATGNINLDGIIIGAGQDAVIDGFEFRNLYQAYDVDCAIRIRAPEPNSVTIRNVLVNRCSGGIKGAAKSLLLEDMEVINGGDGTGSEHNFYVSGDLVHARRVKSSRTISPLDGHVFKCRARETIIEDCRFDNTYGDASAVLDLPNGGKLTLRGKNILIQGANPANGKGVIWYGAEGAYGHTVSPRDIYEWATTWTQEQRDAWYLSPRGITWLAWLNEWAAWEHSYDIQGASLTDLQAVPSRAIFFETRQDRPADWRSPPRSKAVFRNNTTSPGLILPPEATTDAPLPTWAQGLPLNTLVNVGTTTSADAYKAAGYYIPGWEGDASDNQSAWGAGIYAPNLGPFGSSLNGMNGHALQPASTLHCFDWSGKWAAPIAPPSIHREVAPDFPPPPKDAECWYSGGNGKYPSMTWDQVQAQNWTVDHPFTVGAYSFSRWPTSYGCRYDTNIGAAIRYDCLAILPGEPAGVLAMVCSNISHELNIPGSGASLTWRYGLSSRARLLHSVNAMPPRAAQSLSTVTAYSRKHDKVFTANASHADMGVYDPATNSHSSVRANADLNCYAIESNAIVTHGHSSHLLISIGRARGTNALCLYLVEVDKAVASGCESWAIMDRSAQNIGAQRIAPLQGVVFSDASSLAWAEDAQKLVLFTPYTGGRGYGPLSSSTIQIITIPNQWQSAPWPVTVPKLTLGNGVAGLATGAIARGYKRFAYLDKVPGHVGWIGAPESLLPQAIKLW